MPERLGLHRKGVEGRQQRRGYGRGRCMVGTLLAKTTVLGAQVGGAVVDLVTARHGGAI